MLVKFRKGNLCLFDNGNKTSTWRVIYTLLSKQALDGRADPQVLRSYWIPCSVVFIKQVNVDLKKNHFDVQDITAQQLRSLQRVHYWSLSGCNLYRFPIKGITESQNHRIVGVGRDLCGSSSPTTPAEAGSPTAGCTGPCPGGSWISPEKETPQPPWVNCSSAPSPSEWFFCLFCFWWCFFLSFFGFWGFFSFFWEDEWASAHLYAQLPCWPRELNLFLAQLCRSSRSGFGPRDGGLLTTV